MFKFGSKLTKTGEKKQVFIDSKKFLGTGTYNVYLSRELTKLRLVSVGSFGFGFYHLYNYFYGEEELDKTANLLFGTLGLASLIWVGWTTRRTVS